MSNTILLPFQPDSMTHRPTYSAFADSQQRRQSRPQQCFGLGELAGEADQLTALGHWCAQS
jgi:hypothetical protein